MSDETSKISSHKDKSNQSVFERFRKLKCVLWLKHKHREYWLGYFISFLTFPYLIEKFFERIRYKPFINITAADWIMYFAEICGAYATLVDLLSQKEICVSWRFGR